MASTRDLSQVFDHSAGHIFIDPVDDLAADNTGTSLALTSRGEGMPDGVLIIAVVGPGVFTPTAANKLELEVQESTDNSTFTAVADVNISQVQQTTAGAAATATGTFACVDATDRDDLTYSTLYKIHDSDITHIRINANFSGTVTGGIPLAVCAIPVGRRGPQDLT